MKGEKKIFSQKTIMWPPCGYFFLGSGQSRMTSQVNTRVVVFWVKKKGMATRTKRSPRWRLSAGSAHPSQPSRTRNADQEGEERNGTRPHRVRCNHREQYRRIPLVKSIKIHTRDLHKYLPTYTLPPSECVWHLA
jgi:hypothetical protein